MELKKIVAVMGVFALSLSMAPSVFADTVIGTKANSTAPTIAAHNIQLNVEVQDTLSLDCYDILGVTNDHTVSLGATAATGEQGYVTAGVPAVGGTRCNVVTNDDQGYYLTLQNSSNSGAATNGINDVLRHNDPAIANTTYGITEAGLPAYNFVEGGAGSVATAGVDWDSTTPTGLGFSVQAIPNAEANDVNSKWTPSGACPAGTAADTNVYFGVPATYTAETISAVTAYDLDGSTTDVCWKVDVPATQQSGLYSGQVTFTAITDASSYLP